MGLILALVTLAVSGCESFIAIENPKEETSFAMITLRCLPSQDELSDQQLLEASALCASLEAKFEQSALEQAIGELKPDTEFAYLIITDVFQSKVGLRLRTKLQTMGDDVQIYDLGNMAFTMMDRSDKTALQAYTQNPRMIFKMMAQKFRQEAANF